MIDKNDSNPDLQLNDETLDEEVLKDVDKILLQEDPNFLEQLEKIKIETSALEITLVEQALGLQNGSPSKILNYLRKPFEIKLNAKAVIFFWMSVIVSVALFNFTWKYKDNLLHQELFLSSFEKLGNEVRDYNPNDPEQTELFYDNSRFSKNLVTMSPIHVNLKPSESSGNNPMLAIEITMEGLSSDAIVEVKDREAEFKDLLARLTEEKTYDDLVGPTGKLKLCEQYRTALNLNLTRGQIRKVLLKSFIIKP